MNTKSIQLQEVVSTVSKLTPDQKDSFIKILRALVAGQEPEWPEDYLRWKAENGG